MDMLHIVTGSDNNYMAGVMALIASTAFHNPRVRFTVLDMGIAEDNCRKLAELATRLSLRIDRISIEASRFAHLTVRRAHLNRAAYMRLLIPELLPEDDRLVYMDSDMIVVDDLSALMQVELGDCPIAAVADPSPAPRELAATGTRLGEYVNSGLLVMNLPVWRAEKLSCRCLEILSDPKAAWYCEDQSAINIVCRDRIVLLPAQYNIYANLPTYKCVEELPSRISVLHYVVNVKPWMWNVAFGEIWHFHAGRIADLMPPPHRHNWRQKLRRVEAARRSVFGLLCGKRKYWKRRSTAKAIRSQIVLPYLAKAGANPAGFGDKFGAAGCDRVMPARN
ncbi:lipopolysaccharide biosynthesis glycosyltransferase [Paracoccus aminophilus JCM 7686]|uniref:Lipopolysaccharide biosynthesis glycosyltransferase n=2 Tax=Paracoccus aminophilus TaxID=34003 RepID=S5Y1G8_PARAH|nr:lipopolysaccharide biosynthesis glycosyltransferase [Paracoccus aminophilus JCM 7686]